MYVPAEPRGGDGMNADNNVFLHATGAGDGEPECYALYDVFILCRNVRSSDDRT